jgi:hypothetical protein
VAEEALEGTSDRLGPRKSDVRDCESPNKRQRQRVRGGNTIRSGRELPADRGYPRFRRVDKHSTSDHRSPSKSDARDCEGLSKRQREKHLWRNYYPRWAELSKGQRSYPHRYTKAEVETKVEVGAKVKSKS